MSATGCCTQEHADSNVLVVATVSETRLVPRAGPTSRASTSLCDLATRVRGRGRIQKRTADEALCQRYSVERSREKHLMCNLLLTKKHLYCLQTKAHKWNVYVGQLRGNLESSLSCSIIQLLLLVL